MGIGSEFLQNSNDETIKRFREDFPEVAGPLGKLMDEFGNQILNKADARADAVQEQLLEQKVPDLKVCREHPEWSSWLQAKNRYGLSRQTGFDIAMATLNVQALSNLCADFEREKGINLGVTGLGNSGNPGPEGSVSRSFIRNFSIDVARGKYRGREEEAKKIQAQIDAAVAAGKIVNG
jgi:hypothetical protein